MNATYAKNLASLNKLVVVLFSKDTTVVPKASSWFGSYAPKDNDDRSSMLFVQHIEVRLRDFIKGGIWYPKP